MITMLHPTFVSTKWDEIFGFISGAIPAEDVTHHTKHNLLKGVVSGEVQVWMSHRDGHAVGMMITYAMRDSFTLMPFLYIYAVATLGNSTIDDWREAVSSMIAFARNRGCVKVTAATDNEAIARRCESLGANTTTLITWEVKPDG